MPRGVGRRQRADQAGRFVQQICSVWTAEIAEIHLHDCSIVCHHRQYTHLLHIFVSYAKDLKVCVFSISKCSGCSCGSGSGGVELACKATLKHLTFWKGRTKSTKWVLKNARQVKFATPCQRDFIRSISGTEVPLNGNLTPCFPLQHFPINHYISFMYM